MTQRDRVFTKEDLSEDVTDMLRTELQNRIPQALKDEEGPWKLLAYLDEIQPTLEFEDIIYPSFTQFLLLDTLDETIRSVPDPDQALRDALLDLADRALQAERDHLLKSAQELIDKSEESLQLQLDERNDALDTFLEGLKDRDEEAAPPRAQEIVDELSTVIRLPVRLTPEQMRQVTGDPERVIDGVRQQVKTQLTALMVARLAGSFERRLEESLNLRPNQLQIDEWGEVTAQLIQALEDVFKRREQRLLGDQGQIARDLDPFLSRLQGQTPTQPQIIQLLNLMAQGARIAFDRKTHRQGWQRTTRLRYVYLAAHLMGERSSQVVTEEVLEHLEDAQAAMALVWGRSEWIRMLQANATLSSLIETVRVQVIEALGPEKFALLAELPLNEIGPQEREVVSEVLGQRVISEIYRQMLLGVISELWVDYLTRVEALRVSIGLEAYAQRDPLVQYKGRATEMFQELLAEVRIGVISRMFNFRPRQIAPSVEKPGEEALPAAQPAVPVQSSAAPAGQPGHKKKRRRH